MYTTVFTHTADLKVQCVEIRIIYWQTCNLIFITTFKLVGNHLKSKTALVVTLEKSICLHGCRSSLHEEHHLALPCYYDSKE